MSGLVSWDIHLLRGRELQKKRRRGKMDVIP